MNFQQSIFLHARELSDPAERAAYLDSACADDSGLRARVEALLMDHTAADAYFDEEETGEGPSPRRMAALATTEVMPEQIGPYRILERIGHGGMGDVYRAEQRQPIRREVALKLVKLGLDTRQVILRFEAERQALALMDHPNIARVYDAGADERGRPYFVMELVRGEPITAYADRHLLPLKERLMLLQQVCHAIQHAHSKGIIHRDLKPGNVLVSTQDGRPYAKVIDFGIAKATASQLTDGTLFTEFHQFIGTPQYMSPEQAEGSLDIDTRSDVYSLGVLLYELLTGHTPFDADKLRKAALGEIARIIREEEPPKPSTRLGTLALSRGTAATGDILDTLARSRAIAPEQLVKQVRGELDWLVMKSLEKDRSRRYETPNSLAEDISRYLDGSPVTAAPPSAAYRMKKFVRKRKGPVIAGSVVMIALFTGASGLVIGFRRANERADDLRIAKGHVEESRNAALKQRDEAELGAYVGNLTAAQACLNVGDYPGGRRHLEACPERLRAWEWAFLREVAHSVIVTLPAHLRHERAALCSDSKTFVTWPSYGPEAVVWNLAGEKIGEFKFGENEVFLGVAPSGRICAQIKRSHLRLFDKDGRPLGVPMPADQIGFKYSDRIFSANGKRLALRVGRAVRIWDVDGNPIAGPFQHPATVKHVIISRDGGRVATACADDVMRVWDDRGKLLWVVPQKYPQVFLPGDRLVCYEGSFQQGIYDATGAKIGGFEVFDSDDLETILPDGSRFLSHGRYSEEVALRDAEGKVVGHPLLSYPGDLDLAFSADGKWASAVGEDCCWFWDRDGRSLGPPIRSPESEHYGMSKSVFIPNKEQFLINGGERLRLAGINGKDLGTFEGGFWSGGWQEIVPSADGDLVLATPNLYADRGAAAILPLKRFGSPIDTLPTKAGSGDAKAEIIKAELAVLEPKEGASLPDLEIQPIPGGVRITSGGGSSRLGGKPFVDLDQQASVAAVTADASRLVTASGNKVVFWDVKSGKRLVEIPAKWPVTLLSFTSDDTKLILRFQNGNTQLWDSRSFELRQKDRDARFQVTPEGLEIASDFMRKPGTLDEIWNSAVSDTRLSPLKRAIMLAALDSEIGVVRASAKGALELLRETHFTRQSLLEAAKAQKLSSELVRGELVKLAAEASIDFDLRILANHLGNPGTLKQETLQTIVEIVQAKLADDPEDKEARLAQALVDFRQGEFQRCLDRMSGFRTEDRDWHAEKWIVLALAQSKADTLENARNTLAICESIDAFGFDGGFGDFAREAKRNVEARGQGEP